MLGHRTPQQMMLLSSLWIPASLDSQEGGRERAHKTDLPSCPFQGHHGCYQPVPCGCLTAQAHPGYLGHCPHHPGYHCHHDLLVPVPGHGSHHLSNADSTSSQRGRLRPLPAGWRVLRAGVSPLARSQKDSGETRELDSCFSFHSAVGQQCRPKKGPNSVSPKLLSFQLWVMTPAFLPHRVLRTT